ncbi:MAG: hypothetical protein ACPHER_07590 [Nevskiales bacterium]
MLRLPHRFNPNRVPNLSPKAWLITAIALLALVAAEFFVHHHSHFGWDNFFGFYALYGFIASAGLVIGGNLLGKLLKRTENYYDDRQAGAPDAE